MGQFLEVFAKHPESIQPCLGRGIQAAALLFEHPPTDVRQFSFAGLASFERQAPHEGASGHLYTFPEDDSWCLPVGSWVHADGLEPSQSLQRIASTSRHLKHLADELPKIDGSYCFIFGSQTHARTHIVTDPIGQLNVYALRLPETLLLSTSALLLAQIGECSWDMLGVREFLARGTVFGDRSLFSGVCKLEPGSIITFEDSIDANCQRFWSVRDHIETTSTNEQSLDNYRDAVKTGLKCVFRTFNAPVLDLTGGFDTRMVLACTRQVSADDGYDTVVAGASDNADVVSADQIAARLHLRHHRVTGQPQTAQHWLSLAQAALPLVDGEYDILEYARILNVHRQLESHFDISINGTGGELIRGYWWRILFPRTGLRDSFNARRLAQHVFATDSWAEPLLATQFPDTLLEHFTAVITRATGDLSTYRNTTCLDNVYLMVLIHCWQGRIASATNRIWPCLSPLLFRRPIEAAVSAPTTLRRNGRMARRLLASTDDKLARLPMADGYPAMPIPRHTLPYFLLRRTAGIGKDALARRVGRHAITLRKPSQLQELLALEEVKDMLDPSQMLTAELYDRQELRHAVRTIMDHRAPAAHVGRLLTLESLARLRSGSAPASLHP